MCAFSIVAGCDRATISTRLSRTTGGGGGGGGGRAAIDRIIRDESSEHVVKVVPLTNSDIKKRKFSPFFTQLFAYYFAFEDGDQIDRIFR